MPGSSMGLVAVRTAGQLGTSRVMRHALQLAALAGACAWSAPASAQELRSFGVGTFVGFSFGRKAAVEWGFEAFATVAIDRDDLCTSHPAKVVGPLVQLGLLGPAEPRVTLAAHAGYQQDDAGGFDVEAGLTLRFLEQTRYGVHTGILTSACS